MFCDTDELDYVYPVVELSNILGGEFYICNETDDNQEMTFMLDSSYDKYVIDCKLKRIMADGEIKMLDDMGWNVENLSDYNDVNAGIYKAYWLRIVPGLNECVFTAFYYKKRINGKCLHHLAFKKAVIKRPL